MDPFAAALDVMFNAPGSLGVSYQAGTGWSRPVRTIRSQPDVDAPFGQGRVVEGTNLFQFRKSEVPEPKAGDLIILDFEIFELAGEAMKDVEGLTWTIGGFPQQ